MKVIVERKIGRKIVADGTVEGVRTAHCCKLIADRGGRKLAPPSESIIVVAVQGSFQRQKMGIGRK